METDQSTVLVNEQKAGKMLGVCSKTVYNLRVSGQLPFVKIGRAIRYRVEAILEFAKTLESKPE